MFETNQTNLKKVNLKTLGGDLSVCFDKKGQTFTNIILSGPAKQVFKGVWEI
jgi:diaminopimelate epimerase